jgi:hypothetical protein
VKRGQPIGTLGRSTNTREGISADRAHLHFEVGFMLNPRFEVWYRRRDPKAPPFGNFNGQNFIGLNPAELLQASAADPDLNFAAYLARQPVAFTVLLPARRWPMREWQPGIVQELPTGAVAYELAVTSWGMPVQAWARTAEQVGERRLPALHLVNEAILAAANCRELVERRGNGERWGLTAAGRDWLELLTFVP